MVGQTHRFRDKTSLYPEAHATLAEAYNVQLVRPSVFLSFYSFDFVRSIS